MKGRISALRGKERLAIAFWVYGVLGSVVISFSPLLFINALSLIWVAQAAILTYLIFAHVAVWQCAFNADRRMWGVLARCYVIVALGFVAWNALVPQPEHETKIEVYRLRKE